MHFYSGNPKLSVRDYCTGILSRLMHHHLAGLANSLFLLLSSGVRVVGLVSRENGPNDPCGLIGHCDSRHTRWFSFE